MRPVGRNLLTITIALALAAGCSSSADTKSDYVDAVSEARATAFDAFNQIVTATSGNKPETVEQLEAGEKALAESITGLESIDVPEEAQGRHSELVADFGELRRLFKQAANEARTATGTELFSVISDLASEGKVVGARIDEEISRLNEDLDAD